LLQDREFSKSRVIRATHESMTVISIPDDRNMWGLGGRAGSVSV
jgi:hypothetical protein